MGALGIMQILPSTFNEIQDARPHFSDIDDPQWNIAAGIYYSRLLYEQLDNYPEQERMKFTFASYNAGPGRVRRAIRKTPGKNKNWDSVSKHLPLETRLYVNRILQLMEAGSKPGRRR